MGVSLEQRIANFKALYPPIPVKKEAPILDTPTGRLTNTLYFLFDKEKRKYLYEVAHSKDEKDVEEEQEIKKVVLRIFEEFKRLYHVHPSGIRRRVRLGEIETVEARENRNRTGITGKSYLEPVRKHTEEEYANRIAKAFRVMVSLSLTGNWKKAGFIFNDEVIEIISSFKNSEKKESDIEKLLVKLLKQDLGTDGAYHKECLMTGAFYGLINMKDNYTFSSSENSQKNISSMKYIIRIVLFIYAIKKKDSGICDLVKVTTESLSPFSCLYRLHQLICSFPRTIKARTAVLDGKLYFNGVDVSPNILKGLLVKSFIETEKISREVFMGFSSTTGESFAEYICRTCKNNKILKETGKINKRASNKFLKECVRFERIAVVMLHFITACTARGTDYKEMLIDDILSLGPACLLIDRVNNKTTLLGERIEYSSVVAPTKWLELLTNYWWNVRPFCAILAKQLKHTDEIVEKWNRNCFIKGDRRAITYSVNKFLKKYCPSITFQDLRHINEAVFRKLIMPLEHKLVNDLPFDKLFGHSYFTGNAYGALHDTDRDFTSQERLV